MRFSVVIAAGGRHELLANCLQAVLGQRETYTDYEVIVVDYGAQPPLTVPDGVRLIRWVPADGRWSNPIATNIGVAHTMGDRLIILNADILLPEVAFLIVEDIVSAREEIQLYWRRMDYTEDGRLVAHPGKPHGDFLCVARDYYVQVGGYDERMFGWGAYDNDLAGRLSLAGCLEAWIEQPPLLHQWHEPQPTKEQDREINLRLYRENMDTRQVVVNQGKATFDKYRRLP